MKRVAIVGVEGSGKTVLLAGLGDLYSHPDAQGYFLSPKDFRTSAYVAEKIGRMREGAWPAATAEDALQGLDWTLRRKSPSGGAPSDVLEISCLDFAGEIYRRAFVEPEKVPADDENRRQVEALWDYVARADMLLVLVNLRDVIFHGTANRRVHEAMWVTNGLLDEALRKRSGRVRPRAAIVLSQADSYRGTIDACGGPLRTLEKYLPHLANNYGWLPVLEACAVDRTTLDANGLPVPAPDFSTKGLVPIMDWILGRDGTPESKDGPVSSPAADAPAATGNGDNGVDADAVADAVHKIFVVAVILLVVFIVLAKVCQW